MSILSIALSICFDLLDYRGILRFNVSPKTKKPNRLSKMSDLKRSIMWTCWKLQWFRNELLYVSWNCILTIWFDKDINTCRRFEKWAIRITNNRNSIWNVYWYYKTINSGILFYTTLMQIKRFIVTSKKMTI